MCDVMCDGLQWNGMQWTTTTGETRAEELSELVRPQTSVVRNRRGGQSSDSAGGGNGGGGGGGGGGPLDGFDD